MNLFDSLFVFDQGIQLRDTPLWLDARTARPLCFLSNPLIPGSDAHEKVLVSPVTAEVLKALSGGKRSQLLISPFGRRFSLGRIDLELFSAGYLPGASSLKLEVEGQTVVYSGAIDTGHDDALPAAEFRRCDLLLLPCDATALHALALPDRAQIAAKLKRFVEQCIADQTTPVLLFETTADALLVARLLSDGGIAVRAHRAIHAVCQAYDAAIEARWAGAVKRYQRRLRPGAAALLWPLDQAGSPAASQERAKTALVTPRAQLHRRALPAADAAFALSASSDYRGLLDYVRASRPQAVLFVGGYSESLAADLQALGILVGHKGPQSQLKLF
ncbi:MAG: hypothetical protein H6707_13675 [Deltaproteobacteria bacterium]|nr:hypothetical protein [Deltaproteobacteria bacterium]